MKVISIQEFRKIQQPGTRRCSDCGEIKSIEEFVKWRNAQTPDKRMSKCKKCHNLRMKKYRRSPKGKEKQEAYIKRYHQSPEVKEKRRKYRRRYYEEKECQKEKSPPGKNGFIYIFKWDEFYKIGQAKRPKARIKQINSFLPSQGEVLCVVRTNDIFIAEIYLHDLYSHLRQNGEWFKLSKNDVQSLCKLSFIQVDNYQVTFIK